MGTLISFQPAMRIIVQFMSRMLQHHMGAAPSWDLPNKLSIEFRSELNFFGKITFSLSRENNTWASGNLIPYANIRTDVSAFAGGERGSRGRGPIPFFNILLTRLG